MDQISDNQKPESMSMEQTVADTLEHGEMKRTDPHMAAVKRLSPRTIIRIKSEKDPILLETDLYRSMADEVDGRYDAYVEAARQDRSGQVE
jgi:hypothetical protein